MTLTKVPFKIFKEALSEKQVRFKKIDFGLSCFFSESPYQIFRIFGHSLVDRQGSEGSFYTLRWAFFEKAGY